MSVRELICDLPEVPVCLSLRRERLTTAGQSGLEGQKAEVSRWSMGAYIARCNAILSRNQLLGHA